MKNSELTLSLIDLEENKDVVVCISGNYHKITGLSLLGGKILLELEGSIICIDEEFHDYMTKKYPKTTFVESIGK